MRVASCSSGNLSANHGSDGNQCDETSQSKRGSETVQPGRLGHHHPLRWGPLFRIRQRADAEPFPEGRQMAVFWLGVPQRRAFRQFQLRPAPSSFPLLAGEPVPQGVDQIVVSELSTKG